MHPPALLLRLLRLLRCVEEAASDDGGSTTPTERRRHRHRPLTAHLVVAGTRGRSLDRRRRWSVTWRPQRRRNSAVETQKKITEKKPKEIQSCVSIRFDASHYTRPPIVEVRVGVGLEDR